MLELDVGLDEVVQQSKLGELELLGIQVACETFRVYENVWPLSYVLVDFDEVRKSAQRG
jgi:hypothetical protein